MPRVAGSFLFPVLLALLPTLPVAAEEIIFFEDFGCSGAAGTRAGGGVCDGGERPGVGWTQIANPDAQGGETWRTGAASGVNQVVRADSSTASVVSAPSNFSVTTRNWDIHDGSQIARISGYRSGSNQPNTNMQGNMLGHVKSSSTLPSTNEDNYYQINGLALAAASGLESATLSFDFDAFIYGDGDGFGIGVSTDGGNLFSLLLPSLGSAMQYTTLNAYSGDLRDLIGAGPGNTQLGFKGGGVDRAGVALFDLSMFAGQTISLRFAYTSNGNNAGSAEGVNIDNIKVAQVCRAGHSGADCRPPPGTSVPEPAALGLALLGLASLTHRRRPGRIAGSVKARV